MIYINNTLPRHDIPISNSFEIINHINDDFHIVIYYINNCNIFFQFMIELNWIIPVRLTLRIRLLPWEINLIHLKL